MGRRTAGGSRCALLSRRDVPRFYSLDGVFKRLFQKPLSDGPDDEAEQPSLEVLAVAYNDYVDAPDYVADMNADIVFVADLVKRSLAPAP